MTLTHDIPPYKKWSFCVNYFKSYGPKQTHTDTHIHRHTHSHYENITSNAYAEGNKSELCLYTYGNIVFNCLYHSPRYLMKDYATQKISCNVAAPSAFFRNIRNSIVFKFCYDFLLWIHWYIALFEYSWRHVLALADTARTFIEKSSSSWGASADCS